ncbi:MAG: T9SS C-terminal target domain-containing protein [Bacteroidetes bacterium]|nr:MAG: T9SS C-terminal target domain-containing protein [Bacteroidota bacterium]
MNKRTGHKRSTRGFLRKAARYSLVWLWLVLLWNPQLKAQLNTGGTPWSFDPQYELIEPGELVLTPPDLDSAAAEDLLNPIPYRFAINLPVNISIPDVIASRSHERSEVGAKQPASAGAKQPASGIWTSLPSGDHIWLLTIRAPGALAITLYFDRFHLPPGGRLYVYNNERSMLLGAFTELNNSKDGTFATGLIPGALITIEYDHPATSKTLPLVSISEVAYAYRGVPDRKKDTGFGSSGACEVNIHCPEGDSWQDPQKGVARIGVKKVGSTYWCTGTLVNNTRQDNTPYFLTADHCGQGATPQDISQWIFYFHYLSPTCENPPVEPGSRSLTGAELKAASGDVNIKGSDFFLLRLNQSIPDTFDVWFNGWNRQDIPSPDGVGIHHPKGDIKKISNYKTPLVSTNWNNHPEMTHWKVIWAGTVSGHGVTEGGSSGSPLFDPQGWIVGTLTGGEALCDSGYLTLPDYYGKFSYSWAMNGTDSTERLDHWLDPDQTGALVLQGIPLNVPEPAALLPDLLIYPNPASGMGHPASGKLHLQSSEFRSGELIHLAILDSWGREAWSETTPGNPSGEITLEVSSLPDGFYLVKIQTGEHLLTGRFVKL